MEDQSPLGAALLRNLADRQYEKRKGAALEIENLVKELMGAGGRPEATAQTEQIMVVLGRDFVHSSQANHRKGGLIGLAAAALGLGDEAHRWLHLLLPPVLSCFTDSDARVRYYACEALYNVAKVTRSRLLAQWNQVFEGMCRVSADTDTAVRNGVHLLDRLLKDIVADCSSFPLDSFIPLLHQYLEHASSRIRPMLISWILALDALPHVSMLKHLQVLVRGIFGMLTDADGEIRQQASECLHRFLALLESVPATNDPIQLMPVLLECAATANAAHAEGSDNATELALAWILAVLTAAKDKARPFTGDVICLLLDASERTPKTQESARLIGENLAPYIIGYGRVGEAEGKAEMFGTVEIASWGVGGSN